jgi:hypothetical protein
MQMGTGTKRAHATKHCRSFFRDISYAAFYAVKGLIKKIILHLECDTREQANAKKIVMEERYKNIINLAYEAFNARDVDTVLSVMHPDVHWPNGWEGGYVEGHSGVRDYWLRQWKEIDPSVKPLSFEENEIGQIEVHVHQVAKDMQGNILFDGIVKHIYTIADGLIESMEIQKT